MRKFLPAIAAFMAVMVLSLAVAPGLTPCGNAVAANSDSGQHIIPVIQFDWFKVLVVAFLVFCLFDTDDCYISAG
jgi:hypothetical protein